MQKSRKTIKAAASLMTPAGILAMGFLALICVGAGFLVLPVCSQSGQSVGFFNALFTAASATCVTGLITLDTGTAWSRTGQTVILFLIELGGLGFMLAATSAMLLAGKRISLRERVLIRESINGDRLSGVPRTLLRYGLTALAVQACGAVLLYVRMLPRFGVWEGLYQSVFLSVSAFCNAGFDLFGHFDSLTAFGQDAYLLGVVMTLIITGGLGFYVLGDLIASRFRPSRMSLHTRLVLTVSAALTVLGAALFLIVGARGGQHMTVLSALFQSVTARTAGFNSVDQAALPEASQLITAMLMFVGASPASTGGGVKTTTVGVLALVVLAVLRGREDVNLFKKRLPLYLVRTAMAIVFISLMLLLAGTVALCCFQPEHSVISMIYEVASALGTVGMSSAGTPSLGRPAQTLIMLYMYLGRVGPFAMMTVFISRQTRAQGLIHYPEERVMIG